MTAKDKPSPSTYIVAYDAETETCLEGLRRIVEVHEAHNMPATFFIVARLLETQGDEYRKLLGDHPLFEIASHTYTHALLRDHSICGAACPPEQRERELVESRKRLEDFFSCDVIGFRTPCGWDDGLAGDPDLVSLCHKAGYRYSSSLAWGPNMSLPALVRDPFTYAEQGHPDLWEIPASGWHDNVLKGNAGGAGPWLLQLFPSLMPEAMIAAPIKNADEEFAMNRLFIDKACAQGTGHVSLIWHPWSLHKFDPEMTMLEKTFAYVRELGLLTATFRDHLAALQIKT